MTERADNRSSSAAASSELALAHREILRLQQHIAEIRQSRSWRLTRPYRALGSLMQRLFGSQTDPAEVGTPSEPQGSVAVAEDPWTRWPVWTTDESFSTRRFSFVASVTQYDLRSSEEVVAILKDRDFLQRIYRRLLTELQPKRVLEIGFFQGGMPLFLTDMAAPDKIVGIDYYPASD